jgi:carbonic anhydrase
MSHNIKKFLMEGNQRFLDQRLDHHPKLSQPQNTNNMPVCIVVGCSDSRTCAEHIFSQSLGNFFSVRNAGHFVNEEVVASLEFAVSAGIPNIMIYGHSGCGAIRGAVKYVNDPSIAPTPHVEHLLERFQPLINDVMKDTSLTGDKLLQACIDRNILKTKQDILGKSTYLRDLLHKNEITILMGMYEIESGIVHFLD